MRRTIVLLFVAAQSAFSAFEHTAGGALSISMGGAAAALMNDPWSATANPGNLPSIAERTLGMFYSPQPYGLTELSTGSLALVQPLSFGSVGLFASRYGFSLYRETEWALSFGLPLVDRLDAGVGICYNVLSIEGYGTAGTLGINAGILIRLTDDLRWGTFATNVNAPRIGEIRERLPQTFATGVAFQPVEEAVLALDLFKDVRFPMELRFGVEYAPVALLRLRAGTGTEPSSLSAGAGLRYDFVGLDYAFTAHPELGVTHQISLLLDLNRF